MRRSNGLKQCGVSSGKRVRAKQSAASRSKHRSSIDNIAHASHAGAVPNTQQQIFAAPRQRSLHMLRCGGGGGSSSGSSSSSSSSRELVCEGKKGGLARLFAKGFHSTTVFWFFLRRGTPMHEGMCGGCWGEVVACGQHSVSSKTERVKCFFWGLLLHKKCFQFLFW